MTLDQEKAINWPEDELIDDFELSKRTNTGQSIWPKRRMMGGEHTPPFIRIGRSCRYRWGDVKDWLAEQRRNSTSQDAA